MRTVLSAWFAAAAVAGIAFLSMLGLAPEYHPVDEYAQVLRVHLPWLLFSVLMALVAGIYVRDRSPSAQRLAAALPVPIVATMLLAVLDVPASNTLLGAGLHLIEALLGVALALSLVGRIRDASAHDPNSSRRPPYRRESRMGRSPVRSRDSNE